MDTSQTPVVPANLNGARVALVHDWLTGMRGGEKALVYLTDPSRVVYVPTREDHALLLSVAEPERFLEALDHAAAQ